MDVILLAMMLCVADGCNQVPPALAVPARVGQIFIVGNTNTKSAAICDELPGLSPGAVLPGGAELRQAEIRLLKKFANQLGNVAGKGPRIEVVPAKDGTVYHDIRISFPEMPRKHNR
jgi:hypothetical protein